MIDYLVYVSQARPDLTDKDIARILEASRRNNAEWGLSGMLLFADKRDGRRGSFMQLLEGPADMVDKMRDRIFADDRHHTKIVLEQGRRAARVFPDWSMAYKALDDRTLAGHPDFAALGADHFMERCGRGEVTGALEFLCDFWDTDAA
jgi:hypothetical protein